MYVDGVLEGSTSPGQKGLLPQGRATELVLPVAGAVDEIRISKGLRYPAYVGSHGGYKRGLLWP